MKKKEKEVPKKKAQKPPPEPKKTLKGFLQVKKDALWKPLLRQFRRFIKKEALRSYNGRSKASMGGFVPDGCDSDGEASVKGDDELNQEDSKSDKSDAPLGRRARYLFN